MSGKFWGVFFVFGLVGFFLIFEYLVVIINALGALLISSTQVFLDSFIISQEISSNYAVHCDDVSCI